MVASNRELANKSFLNSSIHAIPSSTNTKLPTVNSCNSTEMDFFKEPKPNNYNNVRGRTNSYSPNSSRDTSMVSSASTIPYHERMENNNMVIDDDDNASQKLSYETLQEKKIQLGKATSNNFMTRTPCGNLNADTPAQRVLGNNPTSPPSQGSTAQSDESIFINIQLLYDLNTSTDPEIWNGGFHPISLHGSIEHIASDAKSIKDSLKFIAKYILNKQIEPANANDLKNFNGMSDAVWNFISSVYESNWDSLYTDNKTNTLRRKIAAKFTPRVQPVPKRPTKDTSKSIPASIEKIPPSILAKSQKEINIISKYFKNKQIEIRNPRTNRSYAQASKQGTSTSDVIKINDMFLSIGAKKIDQINKIIKGSPKIKQQINMTTKGPLRKQVIIPMSNDNIVKFIKNFSMHVANINRNLRSIKSEVSVDFI